MKILIDARLYGLENAGLGRYLINLIRELQNIDLKNDYTIFLKKKYYESLIVPKNWKKVKVNIRHYSLFEQMFLPLIIKKENPDLVHFPHFNIPILFNGNFVVTIHDLLMHREKGTSATTLFPPFYFAKRVGYKKTFKHAVFDSQKIIVPSNSVKRDIVSYYKIPEEKISVTYEGFDENIHSNLKNGDIFKNFLIDRPYFMYAGNAYPHKNLKRLIEATQSLNNALGQKILLVLVCPRNVFVKRLEKSIKFYKAENSVRIINYISDSILSFLYKNSLGLVYPSFSEGFGLPGLEAMANGTLALVSDIAVFKEIYKNHAIYFNPYDFTSIEKEMKEVYAMDLKKRARKVKLAKSFVKRYSWHKMALETLKIYEETYKKNSLSLRSG